MREIKNAESFVPKGSKYITLTVYNIDIAKTVRETLLQKAEDSFNRKSYLEAESFIHDANELERSISDLEQEMEKEVETI